MINQEHIKHITQAMTRALCSVCEERGEIINKLNSVFKETVSMSSTDIDTNYKNFKNRLTYLIPPDTKHVCIKQGYMFSTPECTVRVRIVDDKQGFITIKGRKVGIINTEFEYEISLQEAKDAFAFCNNIVVEKTRYYLPNGKHTIELDVFQGKHEGLIIAEIELQDEKDDYIKPSWFDTDVSRLLSFTNVSLARSGRFV